MANERVAMRNNGDAVPVEVLVAARDVPYAQTLVRSLEVEGYTCEITADAAAVLRRVNRKSYSVIVLHLELDEESDVDLVSYIRRQQPAAALILLCELTRIERAIDGVRQGAFFYLPDTTQPTDVALVVRKAVRDLDQRARVARYENTFFEEMLGPSPAMQRVVEVMRKVAPTDSTVLILGESGTGKEVLANTIHRLSNRSEMPFIAINCAALPETLLESEMFGHVKGAFTGADTDKRGLFEEADGGTIFLDEIGDMALVTQAKLLRVLQNGEIRPVGAAASKRVDVRVLAATHRDLEEAVRERQFREDLYFRLNVIQIRIPPLRDRMESLPQLVGQFVQRFSQKHRKPISGIDDTAQVLLRNYDYPGNVRELQSIIEHAVIMADGNTIRAQDLPESVRTGGGARFALPNYSQDEIPSLTEMEAQLIRTALEKLDGNQTEAARRLGISRSTLWRKMKEYDISAPA